MIQICLKSCGVMRDRIIIENVFFVKKMGDEIGLRIGSLQPNHVCYD